MLYIIHNPTKTKKTRTKKIQVFREKTETTQTHTTEKMLEADFKQVFRYKSIMTVTGGFKMWDLWYSLLNIKY